MKVVDINKIKLISVESSSISKIGYEDGILLVEFKNGGKYLYTSVEESKFNDMFKAESVGKYFSSNIKNVCPCIKL